MDAKIMHDFGKVRDFIGLDHDTLYMYDGMTEAEVADTIREYEQQTGTVIDDGSAEDWYAQVICYVRDHRDEIWQAGYIASL